MSDRTCTVEGCTRGILVKSRGLCSPHYQRFMHTGMAEPAVKVTNRCSVDGCETFERTRGMCNKHYLRLRANGSTEIKPKTVESGACVVDGCERDMRYRRMCSMHYQRYLRSGTTDASPNVARGGRAYKVPESCAAEGCDRKAVSGRGGMCNKHHDRVRAHGDALDRIAKQPVNGTSPCTIDGCDLIRMAAGLCNKHYTQRTRGAAAPKECDWCTEVYVPWRAARFCSDDCYMENLRAYGREYQTKLRRDNPKPLVETHSARCIFCHTDFDATRRRYRYCSRACWATDRARGTDPNSQRRKELVRQATVESFSKYEIFERDNWICQICMDPIDREATFPDPLSASLDHIIPIIRGGQHSRVNTRASHLTCNCSKGSRLNM